MFSVQPIDRNNQPYAMIQTPADFWAKVDRREADACWEWQGARFTTGENYGSMTWCGRSIPTHRFAYALVNGPIPDGLVICHACDNPPCCNPAHLWLGTHADNMRDKAQKGRVRNGRPPLTSAQVHAVRRLAAFGFSPVKTAKMLGIRETAVGNVLRGNTWKHIPIENASETTEQKPGESAEETETEKQPPKAAAKAETPIRVRRL